MMFVAAAVAVVVVALIIVYNVDLASYISLSEGSVVFRLLFNIFYWSIYFGEKLGVGKRYASLRHVLTKSETTTDYTDFEVTGKTRLHDTTISGIPVRIYRPERGLEQSRAYPGLIYFHGGGLISGNAKSSTDDKTCLKLSQATTSVVISVDYRLAPEHLFPAQFNDCYSVVSTVMNKPAEFDILQDKVAIFGESGGGLLAAAVSLELAKENRSSSIAAQVLLYPWLQSIDTTCLPSHQGILWAGERRLKAYCAAMAITGKSDIEREYNDGNIARYFKQTQQWNFLDLPESSKCKFPPEKADTNISQEFINAVLDPHFSPLLADTVAGSPSTFVITAEYDAFASEGDIFVRRLRKANVPVTHKIFKAGHAFVSFFDNRQRSRTRTPLAREAIQDIIDYLNSVLNDAFSGL